MKYIHMKYNFNRSYSKTQNKKKILNTGPNP